MKNKSTNTTLLTLTILLCLVVIGLGAYTYSFYTKVKENENELVRDKALIQAELDEEINRYGKLLEEKNLMSSELLVAKNRLEALQKRIDSNEITRGIVQQYQLELRKLRKEREQLFKQNDSLQQETMRLAQLQERTQNSLDSITLERDNIVLPESLEGTVAAPSKVLISNLNAQGVIQRNSGKFVNTSRAGRAQMVRLCYEVNANQKLEVSQVTFYVRVVNENNKLIGVKRITTLDSGEKLSYNTETSIQYQEQSRRVCTLILPIQTFSKGEYTIEVYNKQGLLQSTKLTLK